MGFLNRINPQKVVEGVGKFIDESIQSKEEVSNAIIEHYKISLKESTPKSLTRRYIAVAIVSVFLLMLLGSGIAYLFNDEYSKFLLTIAERLTTLTVTICIFYFGGYYGEKFLKSRKHKKD